MARKRDESIIGQQFGRLVVLGYSHSRKRSPKSGSRTYWLCLCTLCGKERTIERSNLISGSSTSCGCQFGLRRQVAQLAGVTQGTVSIVLSGKGGKFVTPETADRIREISRLLGVQGRSYRDRLEGGEEGCREGCGEGCGRSLSDSVTTNISHEIDHDLVHGI
jgi:transcriptional regulator with XRE-family HTH domain